ncbi:transposon Ty3-G Gag-Pol polyprotein [Trichonephila clavipes]|nr:transposon Ty3-G Gag-Pol polyprotein [Trichonephila clavipes]
MQKGVSFGSSEKIGDRAPITPIVRPELSFEIVNIDVIGPIQPPSGRGHKYVLLIGSSPRFSCPGYPASNGQVERWNKVLKDMIHHVIREYQRSWDRQLPFLLFAYREVPNTTTGVSPFRLLYGREARGPLAILKSSWAGEIHLPTNISQSSVKNFSIGEQVVLLIPESSNNIYARWTGPGEIIQHHPPHSYKVKLSDGTVRHVHVNKIRKYHPRALVVGVIFEDDHEFGEIHPTPNLSRSTSERVLHENESESSEGEQQEKPMNTVWQEAVREAVDENDGKRDLAVLLMVAGRSVVFLRRIW